MQVTGTSDPALRILLVRSFRRVKRLSLDHTLHLSGMARQVVQMRGHHHGGAALELVATLHMWINDECTSVGSNSVVMSSIELKVRMRYPL